MKDAFNLTEKASSVLEISESLYFPPSLFSPYWSLLNVWEKLTEVNPKVYDVIVCLNRNFKLRNYLIPSKIEKA